MWQRWRSRRWAALLAVWGVPDGPSAKSSWRAAVSCLCVEVRFHFPCRNAASACNTPFPHAACSWPLNPPPPLSLSHTHLQVTVAPEDQEAAGCSCCGALLERMFAERPPQEETLEAARQDLVDLEATILEAQQKVGVECV